jgi:hypothetical protein
MKDDMIVNHIAGNMRSLFTDFLRSDGEKSSRNRDSEFDQPFQNRSDLITYWNQGWEQLFGTLIYPSVIYPVPSWQIVN